MGGWLIEVRNEGGHWVQWEHPTECAIHGTEAEARAVAEQHIGAEREWRTRDTAK